MTSPLFVGGKDDSTFPITMDAIMVSSLPKDPVLNERYINNLMFPTAHGVVFNEKYVEFFEWLVSIGVTITNDWHWTGGIYPMDDNNVFYMRKILNIVGIPHYVEGVHDYRTKMETFPPVVRKKMWKTLTIEEFYTRLLNSESASLGIDMNNYKLESNPRHYETEWNESWGAGYDSGFRVVLREGKKVWPVGIGPIIKLDTLDDRDSMGSEHTFTSGNGVDFEEFLWRYGPYDKTKSDLSNTLVEKDDKVSDEVTTMFGDCLVLME